MNIIRLLTEEEKKFVQILNFKRGQNIFYENEICTMVCFVLYGIVKIHTYGLNDNEIIFNTIQSNGVFGNNLVFSENQRFKGDVVADSDVTLACISKKNLIKILQENERFLIEYLAIQSDFGKSLNDKIKLLSIGGVEDRLLYLLKINNNEYEYRFISKMADEIGVSREALSRCISNLIKKGVIGRRGKTIFYK